VFAVPVNFTVRLPPGLRVTAAFLAGLMPASAWEARSCGRGCKGHRDYAWGWAGLLAAALGADPPQPV
jgi:hypothetical protein